MSFNIEMATIKCFFRYCHDLSKIINMNFLIFQRKVKRDIHVHVDQYKGNLILHLTEILVLQFILTSPKDISDEIYSLQRRKLMFAMFITRVVNILYNNNKIWNIYCQQFLYLNIKVYQTEQYIGRITAALKVKTDIIANITVRSIGYVETF
jgi:hypothetical protein